MSVGRAIYAQWGRGLSWEVGNANQSNKIYSSSSSDNTGEGWPALKYLWETGFGQFDQRFQVGKQKYLLSREFRNLIIQLKTFTLSSKKHKW